MGIGGCINGGNSDYIRVVKIVDYFSTRSKTLSSIVFHQ
jgi:hypothetical protein